MGRKRLFDHEPDTGLTTWYEDTDDGFQLTYEQDAEPILISNKIKRDLGREYYARDKDMWRVASIPVGIQLKWLIEHGVDVYNKDHWKGVQRLLNDPEWRYLKTAEVII